MLEIAARIFVDGKVVPINSLIDSVRREQREKAKSVLPSIVDTVILCGHIGIPLRGHRDNRKSFPEAGEFSKISGFGNFVELLNFAIRRGDDLLKNHYICLLYTSPSPRDATLSRMPSSA